jgi:hypothetical protein
MYCFDSVVDIGQLDERCSRGKMQFSARDSPARMAGSFATRRSVPFCSSMLPGQDEGKVSSLDDML